MPQCPVGDPGRRVRITNVKVTPIVFRDPPLRNAAGVHEPYALRSIIEISASNGQTGLGEGYGDAASLMALEAVAPHLVGLEITDLNGLHGRIGKTLAKLPPPPPGQELAPGSDPARQGASCFSAFEVPLLDLQAKTAGLPLHALLGGAVRHEVPFSAYLFFKFDRHIEMPQSPDCWGEASTPGQIVAQAQRMISLHGFKSIKLKGGTLPPAVEVASIEALAEAFPGYPLRIDPNGAWSMETAITVAAKLGHLVEYYEDPVDGLEAMAELHRRTGLPLATNMVVTCFDHVRSSVASNAVQIVLSDHHYWGGLRASQHLATICATFGLGLSMHSNSHLGISLMAMAHLAATTPNLTYACDTHYPWVEDEDEVLVGGKIAFHDGCVRLSEAPGLGIELDQDRLKRAHQMFLDTAIRSRNDTEQMRKYDPDFFAAKPRF